MKVLKLVTRLVVAGVAVVATTQLVQANLVLNGGFETGSFADWSTADSAYVSIVTSPRHSGTYAAELLGGGIANLSQNVNLPADTAEVVTFWLDDPHGGGSLAVTLDGVGLGTLSAVPLPGSANQGWTEYTQTVTPTHSGSQALVFNWEGSSGYPPTYFNLYLDDISVTPVPEPTTIIAGAMLLVPFGASTLRILRRSREA